MLIDYYPNKLKNVEQIQWKNSPWKQKIQFPSSEIFTFHWSYFCLKPVILNIFSPGCNSSSNFEILTDLKYKTSKRITTRKKLHNLSSLDFDSFQIAKKKTYYYASNTTLSYESNYCTWHQQVLKSNLSVLQIVAFQRWKKSPF